MHASKTKFKATVLHFFSEWNFLVYASRIIYNSLQRSAFLLDSDKSAQVGNIVGSAYRKRSGATDLSGSSAICLAITAGKWRSFALCRSLIISHAPARSWPSHLFPVVGHPNVNGAIGLLIVSEFFSIWLTIFPYLLRYFHRCFYVTRSLPTNYSIRSYVYTRIS